jgi:transketolase
MPEPISMREAYGKELVSLGGANENVVVLSADVQTSDYSHLFGQAFPERFFNVGIAEQCLVDVAVASRTRGVSRSSTRSQSSSPAARSSPC